MDRRDVLRGLASGAAAPLLGAVFPTELLAWGREVHAAASVSQAASGLLTEPVMRTLTVACERIIPADDTPGATAAGVPAFIARMLSDWYDPPDRARVIAGIESLDALSRTRHGRAFADCSGAEQDALLLELDRQGPTHWFGTVKYLTIWGYYTSEVGVVRELGQWPSPGRYDGCAPYAPRRRGTQVQQ
jgi:gluconate 2-dehydrogenase gamma chain